MLDHRRHGRRVLRSDGKKDRFDFMSVHYLNALLVAQEVDRNRDRAPVTVKIGRNIQAGMNIAIEKTEIGITTVKKRNVVAIEVFADRCLLYK